MTMIKAFRRFRDSITLSTSTDLRTRPNSEHRPAVIPKTKEGRGGDETSGRAEPLHIHAGMSLEDHGRNVLPPVEGPG